MHTKIDAYAKVAYAQIARSGCVCQGGIRSGWVEDMCTNVVRIHVDITEFLEKYCGKY